MTSRKQLYVNGSPYKVSRNSIQLFKDCPLCFYLGEKHGVKRPPSFPLTLNQACDILLKREFDIYRTEGQPHPLMTKAGINAIPWIDLPSDWRNNRKGIVYNHPATGWNITGSVDDIWVKSDQTLVVADYKVTSTATLSMDDEYKTVFKHQLEIYQWLLERNGFNVDDTAYIVYGNALKPERFDNQLQFDMQVFPHKGDRNWISDTLLKMKECLDLPTLPSPREGCKYCTYRADASEIEIHPRYRIVLDNDCFDIT